MRGAAGPRADTWGERNLDSELRFYGVWRAFSGAVMRKAATDAETDRALGGVVAAGWAASALSRLLSTRSVGRPDPLFVELGVLEALVAAVLLGGRAAEERGSRRATAPRADRYLRPLVA